MRNLWTSASIAALTAAALATPIAVYAQETTALIRGSVAAAESLGAHRLSNRAASDDSTAIRVATPIST